MRGAGFDFSGGADFAEVFVDLFEFGGGGGVLDAEEEFIADVTAGVVVAVELLDVVDGILWVVGDVVEVGVFGGDEAVGEEFVLDVFVPGACQ